MIAITVRAHGGRDAACCAAAVDQEIRQVKIFGLKSGRPQAGRRKISAATREHHRVQCVFSRDARSTSLSHILAGSVLNMVLASAGSVYQPPRLISVCSCPGAHPE
jgi:hypothetical protein